MEHEFVAFVRSQFNSDKFIPLHEPVFCGNEKEYVADTIDSTFVSTVGAYVRKFEEKIEAFTGVKHAIATVNGTSALHGALLGCDVVAGDEVITQSLTFVATCNAISYCGATPIFVDVSRFNMGMCPDSLEEYLSVNTEVQDGQCINKASGKKIAACVPMNTFGHPVQIDRLKNICEKFCIHLVEDSAESLGSYYKGEHTGSGSDVAIFSFNGNKIVTTGGGGVIVTNNDSIANRLRHVTTTAKVPHKWDYEHDVVGFNYRMPNINAALGCAQIESLDYYIERKRELASNYKMWAADAGVGFVEEPESAKSNYWLNALVFDNRVKRDEFLDITNSNGVMTRPAWIPMHKLNMYKSCHKGSLDNTEWLVERLVNIPSGVIHE